MKKIAIVFLLLLLIGLAGIGGWSLKTNRQTRASAEQYVAWAQSQKMVAVDFVITAPPETPLDQTLYLSGDASEMGGWDAAGVPLHRDAAGKYHGSVQLLSGISHQFKVTRGTWGTVERGPGGVDIADHSFTGEPSTVVEAAVQSWVDGGKSVPGTVTLTGLFRLHKKFESKLLGNSHTIIVYLPPDYETQTDHRYPVLYMQDGQNLFDSSTAFAGIEWRVDEAAQELIGAKKIGPVIIVGIYNSPDRTAEFTPFGKTPNGTAGRGTLYGRFLIEEVKPMIDKTYRTFPDRAHTAIAGSSLGGLITLAIAHDHPDTFSAVAVLDPWLRDGQHSLMDTWKDDAWMKGIRFYADMGTNGKDLYPGTTEVLDLNQLSQLLGSAGLRKGADYLTSIVDGAEHNETAWQQRVPNVLMFLYGN
jgi:predicted alpha/beta superfamily hydrolase